MKNRIVFVCTVVFSTICIVFPSKRLKAESFNSFEHSALCLLSPPRQTMKRSEAVFSGKVISEEKKGDYRIFQFEAQRYWKGTKTKKITIEVYETPRFQAWFEVGEEYLVFADEIDGKLQVGRCSRINKLSAAKGDLKSLGKGKRSK